MFGILTCWVCRVIHPFPLGSIRGYTLSIPRDGKEVVVEMPLILVAYRVEPLGSKASNFPPSDCSIHQLVYSSAPRTLLQGRTGALKARI